MTNAVMIKVGTLGLCAAVCTAGYVWWKRAREQEMGNEEQDTSKKCAEEVCRTLTKLDQEILELKTSIADFDLELIDFPDSYKKERLIRTKKVAQRQLFLKEQHQERLFGMLKKLTRHEIDPATAALSTLQSTSKDIDLENELAMLLDGKNSTGVCA